MPGKLTGYRFLTKDPICDLIRTALASSGLKTSQIATDAEVAPGTIANIDFGKTRRPQHNTTRCIMEACGYQEVWVTPDNHRLKVDYSATSRSGRIKAANGKGWHTIRSILPRRPRKKT